MAAIKKLAAVLAAGALVLAIAGQAAAVVKYATVWGHYASVAGDKSNEGDFWVTWLNANAQADLNEGDCWKLSDSDFAAVNNGDGTADLGVAYGWVIVKQASSAAVDFDNTIFKDVAADETVFADTDGDGVYGEGDSHGISHIIVCAPTTTTTTTTTSSSATTTTTTSATTTTTTTTAATTTTTAATTTTTSFSQTVSGTTDTPTEPNTATVVTGGPSTPADSAWLLVVALGVLLGSVVVLAPAKAKAKR